MKTWVLIVTLYGGNAYPPVLQPGFKTEVSCLTAADDFKKQTTKDGWHAYAYCITGPEQ